MLKYPLDLVKAAPQKTIRQLTRENNKLRKQLHAAESRELTQMLRANRAEEKLHEIRTALNRIL